MGKIFNKKIINYILISLLLTTIIIPTLTIEEKNIVKADTYEENIQWDGWWINGNRNTVAYINDYITAKITFNNIPNGEYRFKIYREISESSDTTISTKEIQYNGGTQTYDVSFTALTASGNANTIGYYIEIFKKNIFNLWDKKWTLSEYYPPRLRIFENKDFRWTYYHSIYEINDGLETLASDENAIINQIGTSIEGREINAIKISDNPSFNDPNEPDILFVGLHHAREWISAEVPYYIAHYLLSNYQTDAQLKSYIDNTEIWIIPVLNPDGFEYSQQGKYDVTADGDNSRFWRKNRNYTGNGNYGVDLNRNYGHSAWGTIVNDYCSNEKADQVYMGKSAFSELETKSIRDLITNSNNNFKALISYHNYGALNLYPWAFTKEKAEDYSLLSILAEGICEELKSKNGVNYISQQSSKLYPNAVIAGDLTDWIYEEKQIPAFTIELPPKSNIIQEIWGKIVGPVQFHLEENLILPTCEENWLGAEYLIKWVMESEGGGFMDFEEGIDEVPISSTIPGMSFTTTMGYDWLYGDKTTGQYNVHPYNGAMYECMGNVFAWLGPNQGQGRIDFTGSTARRISLLSSNNGGFYLDAYNSNDELVDTDFAPTNINTGTMDELTVESTEIAYIIAHDTGNFWLIDNLRVNDLLRRTSAFRPLNAEDVFTTLDIINQDQTKSYQFFNDKTQKINVFVNWPGSSVKVKIIDPNQTLYFENQSNNPPLKISIPTAKTGEWNITIKGTDIPYSDYPIALDVSYLPDLIPPITTIHAIGPYDSNDSIISTHTILNLTAIDDNSGVNHTYYRIWHDNTWHPNPGEGTGKNNNYFEYLNNFQLFKQGRHFIEFYSTDKENNIEHTQNNSYIVDNNHFKSKGVPLLSTNSIIILFTILSCISLIEIKKQKKMK